MNDEGFPVGDLTLLYRIEHKLDALSVSLGDVAKIQAVQQHRLDMLEKQMIWLFVILMGMGALSLAVAAFITFREWGA